MRSCVGWVATILFGVSLAVAAEDDSASRPATWPRWRGPHRDGSIDAPRWPEKLSGDALRPSWRVALGPGYSGPIVGEKLVFVTETIDKQREVVRALDRRSGQQVWEAG